jgi:hypothetical protein
VADLTDLPDDGPLVDPEESEGDLSKHMLGIADAKWPKWFTYRRQIDMADPDDVADLLAELGDVDEGALPDDKEGSFYLTYIIDRNGNRTTLLLPEGLVAACVLVLAAREDAVFARRLEFFPGMMP